MARQLPISAEDKAAPVRTVNWWLRLTSYGWDRPATSLAQRELVRRSQLASWIILTLLIVDAILLPLGLGDTGTLIAVLVGAGGFLFAAYLNRHGQVFWAGGFLIVLICAALLGAIASEPAGLLLDLMPTYDLFVMAVLVAASILPRRSAFVVAGLTSLIICLDFFLEPHAADLQRDLATFPSVATGVITLLARPIALQILVATVAFLWVRGTERAIERADRAEEVARLEHAIAEQKQQLEAGVTEIENTLIKMANGQYTVRVSHIGDQQLWRIGSALNNLFARVQRNSQYEHELKRTYEEAQRLVQSIEAAKRGAVPMWPTPSGTPIDLILQQITGYRATRLDPPTR
jgi:hypothetical protein